MGKIFLEHPGGEKVFSCSSCDTALTNRESLMSTGFNAAHGRGYLFAHVVNLTYGKVKERIMLTGLHLIRDAFCKNCDTKIGWMYEFTKEESERYKEGKVLLEQSFIIESDGLDEDIWKGQQNH